MMFYDCHAHQVGTQAGGLMIAIENSKVGDMPVYSNLALRQADLGEHFCKVEYVTHAFQKTTTRIVKYHPRFEGYSAQQVLRDIAIRRPVAVVIDTLNAPFWTSYDYWKIAHANPDIQFLFSHAGGYDIQKFLEMCHFTKNIWLDFSYIQNFYGVIGDRPKYKMFEDAMEYALVADFKGRILFGSDYPEYPQERNVAWYEEHNAAQLMNENFERFRALIENHQEKKALM